MDLNLTPETTMDIEPELTTDHEQEPSPSTVPGAANMPILKLEPDGSFVPKPEPITRPMLESVSWGQLSQEASKERWLINFFRPCSDHCTYSWLTFLTPLYPSLITRSSPQDSPTP